MERQKAFELVRMLAAGTDPATGADLPREHVCQQPEVIRALGAARDALGREVRRDERMAMAQSRQPNTGKSWTSAEDNVLLSRFKGGATIETLAGLHGRTNGGIRARLEKLGQNTVGLPGQGQGAPPRSGLS